jgi:WD40 repeat protein
MIRVMFPLALALALAGLAMPANPPDLDREALPAGAVTQFGTPRLQASGPATFSPDGSLIATGGDPICIWDVATGKLVRTHKSAGSVFELVWRPDGKLAALTFFGHNVFLMQEWAGPGDNGLTPERYQELHDAADRVPGMGRLVREVLSRNGSRVVAVREENDREHAEVYAFAPNTPSALATPTFRLPLPRGHGVWLSDDGAVLIAHASARGPGRGRLVAFNVSGPKAPEKPLWELDLGNPAGREPVYCRSMDGKRIVVLCADDAVQLWDGSGAKRLRDWSLQITAFNGGGEWPGVGLSADGNRLALCVRTPNALMGGQVIDLATGAHVAALTPGPMPPFATWSVEFSPDGKRLARAGSSVRIWDAGSGADACPLPGHRGGVVSLAVAGDGATVVSAGGDLTVRGWDPATGREKWRAEYPQVMTVRAVTPNTVAVAESWTGAAVAAPLLDMATGAARRLPGAMGQERPQPPGVFDGVTRDSILACAPDGKSAVTLDRERPALRLWSWPAGELQATLPIEAPGELVFDRCRDVAFTPDGMKLVALIFYTERMIRQGSRASPDHYPYLERWDVAARKRIDRSDLGPRITPSFVANRSRLLVVREGAEVRDAVSGELQTTLVPGEGQRLDFIYGHSVALSPDGRTLAVGAGWEEDGSVHLFDLKTGRVRATLRRTDRAFQEVAYLPNDCVVSGGSTAMVWKTVP